MGMSRVRLVLEIKGMGDVMGKASAGDQGHGEMSGVSLVLEIKGMGDVKGKFDAGDQGHGRSQR